MKTIKSGFVFGLGLLLLTALSGPIHAEDLSGIAGQDNSGFVKMSKDHRVKVTLLYAGAPKSDVFSSRFAVVYLLEDGRTHGQLVHDGVPGALGDNGDDINTIWSRGTKLKDSTNNTIHRAGASRIRFSELAGSIVTKNFPMIKIPDVEAPALAAVYTAYFDTTPTAAFDISIWLEAQSWYPDEKYGTVTFSGITPSTFASH